MFVGRDYEIQQFRRIAKLSKSSLVVCRGRRRIGKSTLIEHYAEEFPKFYEFQGLAPWEKLTNSDQLANFSSQLADQLDLPLLQLRSWHEAFVLLGRYTEQQHALILLDEISWMASEDRSFVGQLKIAWDTVFKKNSRLMLVLCGSVSSWIDKNILNSADFMGRVSLTIDLRELALSDCNKFWGTVAKNVSSLEKFRILSVMGGVPRYLEEVDYSVSAEANITELCFRRGGILFTEFDKIFNDIFQRRSGIYRKIVSTLADGSQNFSDICATLKIDPNGAITGYLVDLVSSGFIQRDYVYSPKTGKRKKQSKYRLKDNYLRFFLKYIEPVKESVNSGIYEEQGVIPIQSFEGILGLQFENLVLNNLPQVLKLLQINSSQVRSASPYFQNKTKRQKSCQIDLLIDTKYAIYICEIKFRKHITGKVVDEVQEKAKRLNIDSCKSVRKALIYVGEMASDVEKRGAFDHIISFEQLLNHSQ